MFEKVKRKRETLDRLRSFKDLLNANQQAWDRETEKMDLREEIYRGSTTVRRCCEADEGDSPAYHVRNLALELIETEIDNNIPYPIVTPLDRRESETAKKIEEYLTAVIDYLPLEEINDMAERTAKIQGGVFYLVEYDAESDSRGAFPITLRVIHPKWVVPQHGVFDSIEKMDYIFLKVPQTKESIRRRYGVDPTGFSEEEPFIKSSGDPDSGLDMVTQYYCYYRNEKGGIGLFSWTNDTVLCDLNDYQSRRLERCTECGKIRRGKSGCECGNNVFAFCDETEEELFEDIPTKNGVIRARDENGNPRSCPYYKPNRYPLVLQKNVSVFGQLLGDSDIDKIADQQNTSNRVENMIIERLVTGGTYMTLPPNAEVETGNRIGKEIRVENLSEKTAIGTFDMQGDIGQACAYLEEIYQEARQTLGITDAFQGRRDTSTISGVAKEFSAAQTEKRFASKKIMKRAAFAEIYETIFKMSLAYFDEIRDYFFRDACGEKTPGSFSRYDFLREDENGLHYCDAFLFSCEAGTTLAADREKLWEEAEEKFSSGAFGDPGQKETQILYWQLMENLHYPMAGRIRRELEKNGANPIGAIGRTESGVSS